jgi:hypothetical protein
MNTFMQPFSSSPSVPEDGLSLPGHRHAGGARGRCWHGHPGEGVEWAREQGYEHVALHFASANLPGAKFWQSSGFRPVEHGMRRRVDERIAWATGKRPTVSLSIG